MATPKRQRIAIFAIMIMMVVGTLGSFLIIILQNENQQTDDREYQAAMTEYQKSAEEYQKKVDAQAAELSAQHIATFRQYADRPGKFNKDEIKELSHEDLLVGTGEEIGDDSHFAAYYIGWDPDGNIFDQSLEGDKLKSPLPVDGLKNASLIDGWKEGMKGMKIGGVREIIIPSDKAYGEAGGPKDQSGRQKIGPNTPLKFVVMAIDQPAKIAEPAIPDVLMRGMR